MNKNINLVELLKDCPEGMELDCVVFDNVTFSKIDLDSMKAYPIVIKTNEGHGMRLTKYGTYINVPEAKCLIFPKGKTTWEGFNKPFTDGDIVMCGEDRFAIFKEHISHQEKGYLITYHLYYDEETDYLDKGCGRCIVQRLATEDEVKRLFDALQIKGYHWDIETKTLKALDVSKQMIKPKFKAGDKIVNRLSNHMGASASQAVILGIDNNNYMFTDGSYINISDQDSWELAPDFKEGDVLYIDCNSPGNNYDIYQYIFILKEITNEHIRCYCYVNNTDTSKEFKTCNLASTKYTPRFATNEEKQKLFEVIRANGYNWNSETKTLKKLKLTESKFKDGDIITNKNTSGTWIGIYREDGSTTVFSSYCYMRRDGVFRAKPDTGHTYCETRLATEEESKKLLDVIKKNGYSWNPTTKTLEYVAAPEFKVGDSIQSKTDSNVKFTITTIEDKAYYGSGNGHEFMIPIVKQCNWELVPKFKVGDRIQSKDGLQSYTVSGVTSDYYFFKIPGDSCIKILPIKDQNDWTLVQKVKWTPKSLEHFDKVLVRQYDTNPWCIDFFSYYDEVGGYVECTGGIHYNYCIPYNENTKNLVGKLNDTSEVYKYWEK